MDLSDSPTTDIEQVLNLLEVWKHTTYNTNENALWNVYISVLVL